MERDLKTAAFMLGTSEEMLLRWVKQGVIQPISSDGEPSFDDKILNAWAAKRRMPIRSAPEGDAGPGRVVPADASSLAAVMGLGGVHFNVRGNDVRSVFSATLDRVQLPVSVEKEELLDRLLAREALASTGIGGGIALPHPRKPLADLPDTGIVATCFLESPVDFNSVDGQPVFVLFMLLSPTTKRHLELLSKLSFSLSNPALSRLLPSIPDEKRLLDAVFEVEEALQTNVD